MFGAAFFSKRPMTLKFSCTSNRDLSRISKDTCLDDIRIKYNSFHQTWLNSSNIPINLISFLLLESLNKQELVLQVILTKMRRQNSKCQKRTLSYHFKTSNLVQYLQTLCITVILLKIRLMISDFETKMNDNEELNLWFKQAWVFRNHFLMRF